MTDSGRMVVIGVGNAFRGDDGAGLEVARRLRARLPPRVEVLLQDGDPAELLEGWREARIAYVIDAVVGGGLPGTVHRVEIAGDGVAALPATLRRDSSHGLGLGEAVELARVLGRLPHRLVLLGIAGKEFDVGTGLGREVDRAVAEVVEILTEEVGAACA